MTFWSYCFIGTGSGKSLGEKKIGQLPLLESIPRAQGPFRSGQDNMEPVYDNSREQMEGNQIGPRIGMESGMTDKDEDETGNSGRRARFTRIVQKHLETALGIAGDFDELKEAIVDVITNAFEDIMLNLTVNSMLDGNAINKSQKKYQIKQVSLYS